MYGFLRLRFNLFTANNKAAGWVTRPNGQNVRIHNMPKSLYQRVLESGTLTDAKRNELIALRAATNPAKLTRLRAEVAEYELLRSESPSNRSSGTRRPGTVPPAWPASETSLTPLTLR
ncbi:MAG: hypothetical protein U0990_10470 [Candidatus Nanopelagicales bacterium]|nr:hypothetical protein [Candidatus Nanopelagicales bacterium]